MAQNIRHSRTKDRGKACEKERRIPRKKAVKLIDDVNSYYSSTHICNNSDIQLADVPNDSISAIFNKWVKQIFDSQKPILSEALITETATYLSKAISDGYNKPIYTASDVRMVSTLLNNTWQFAGFKIAAQAEHINSLLVDENGTPRSFEAFKKQADKVGTIYNQNWLQTEYQHAIAASQATAKYVDIQANKKALPLLQYDTAGDNKVRANHAALDGITLPVDHPFWDKYMAPWEWACRCTTRQLAAGNVTPKGKVAELTEKAGNPRFTNIGKTGIAFPENLPFFKANNKAQEDIKAIAAQLGRASITAEKISLKQKIYAAPVKNQYTTIDEFDNGGKVEKHVLAEANMRDWQDVYGIAKAKAATGQSAKILPVIDKAEKDAREKLMPGHIGYTNADLLIDGKLFEVEKTSSYKNLNQRIAAGAKQANRVCVIYTNAASGFKLGKNTKGIFKDLPNLELVEFYNADLKLIASLTPKKIKKGK